MFFNFRNLYNINWNDFLMTYNLANENFILDIYQVIIYVLCTINKFIAQAPNISN